MKDTSLVNLQKVEEAATPLRRWGFIKFGVVMNKRIPCEDDLNSSNPETFAQAAMQCQHSGSFCTQDGYCHFNGDCFVKQNLSPEEMIQEMQFMKDELRDARSKFTQMESKLVSLISQLENAKQRALDDGKSERVFALRHCLSFLKIGLRNEH